MLLEITGGADEPAQPDNLADPVPVAPTGCLDLEVAQHANKTTTGCTVTILESRLSAYSPKNGISATLGWALPAIETRLPGTIGYVVGARRQRAGKSDPQIFQPRFNPSAHAAIPPS